MQTNLYKAFSAAVVDRNSVPQDKLNIVERVRTNPLPWTGQFSPQLAEQLLATFAPRPSIVLDPFVGSGTSLIEAARLGFSAFGCDLNIAAVILSRLYGFTNLEVDQRKVLLDEVRESLHRVIAKSDAPIFTDELCQKESNSELVSSLVDIWHGAPSDAVRDLTAALIILCDFGQKAIDARAIQKTWFRLERTVLAMPYSTKSIIVKQSDARALPIEPMSVDLVITSPPYINVHNYHQKYRRSVEALGWNVLDNASSEIGSNRQNRANRFLTVIQYSLDMALVLREMSRVVKPNARLILILGRESKVRGVKFFNGGLVAEIAVRSIGLELERRQERVFRNRYGKDIYEDILHFRSRSELADLPVILKETRQIAGEVISVTKSECNDDAHLDIQDALDRIDTVSPSPIHESNS